MPTIWLFWVIVFCNKFFISRLKRHHHLFTGQIFLHFTICFVYRMQEQPLGGPRIKHVCRAAAVALGQPRATVPDDIPRLSALPLHEREGISFSPAAEGTVRPRPWISSRI